jgi:rSAM/selenodomain-associated transferase 1
LNNFPDQRVPCSRALIVFARKPLPGSVKTRLSPPLSAEDAARLYECMLLDTLDLVQTLDGITPFIFFQEDSGAAGYFSAVAPGVAAAPQQGVDLGERMHRAFAQIFARGFSETAIIGSDSPDLPPAYVHAAFSALAQDGVDVVFGPAADGGYYLLALKRMRGELFMDIPWSSSAVLACSVARAKASLLGVTLLPQWNDVDTPADLTRPSLLAGNSPAVRTGNFLRQRTPPAS